MKKKISFIKLCQMIKENRQPKEITVDNLTYRWTGEDYRHGWLEEYLNEYSLSELLEDDEIIEYDEPVLDDIEKEYLGNVLKPFLRQGRVEWVVKHRSKFLRDYINVGLSSPDDVMGFPSFESGEMYQNMETDHRYTPEELGL